MSIFGKDKKEKKDKRFEVVYKESSGFSAVRILRDKRTGVQYLFVAEGYGGGLTPLLDMDGRPLRV